MSISGSGIPGPESLPAVAQGLVEALEAAQSSYEQLASEFNVSAETLKAALAGEDFPVSLLVAIANHLHLRFALIPFGLNAKALEPTGGAELAPSSIARGVTFPAIRSTDGRIKPSGGMPMGLVDEALDKLRRGRPDQEKEEN